MSRNSLHDFIDIPMNLYKEMAAFTLWLQISDCFNSRRNISAAFDKKTVLFQINA